MPNLPAHIQMAQQAAARLGHPVLKAHEGAFLLGATTPDIRAMTKWPRERTHFAPLSVEEVGAGMRAMLEANPHLSVAATANEPTRAFVSGYINHLIADETWICTVYRRFFGGGETPEGKVRGNMWDRAMQLDMDREAKADEEEVRRVTELMEGAEAGVEIGFVGRGDVGGMAHLGAAVQQLGVQLGTAVAGAASNVWRGRAGLGDGRGIH